MREEKNRVSRGIEGNEVSFIWPMESGPGLET